MNGRPIKKVMATLTRAMKDVSDHNVLEVRSQFFFDSLGKLEKALRHGRPPRW